MNYNCVILAGVLLITTVWWLIHARKHYPGPILCDLNKQGERGLVIPQD
jgi:hypothetical protein